jgi:hypothetical protein
MHFNTPQPKLHVCLPRLVFITALLAATNVSAERWLILPPRVENAETVAPGELARGMALYMRASRISEIAHVNEAEACLKGANLRMDQKIAPEVLPQVAKLCRAERMLLTRVRRKQGNFEITSKVYYGESGLVTDTLTSEAPVLLTAIGTNLKERFGKAPFLQKNSGADLVVAGDLYGAGYFDWQLLANEFPQLDSVKTTYCLTDSRGEVQQATFSGDPAAQRSFLQKLRHESFGDFALNTSMTDCIHRAIRVARNEGRGAQLLLIASAHPTSDRAQITVRATVRKLARAAKITIAPTSTSSATTQKFWLLLVRELGDNAAARLIAQRVKVGLAGGQEWFIFRSGGRLYELRTSTPGRLEGGIQIPEKYSDMTSPTDLVKLYSMLSGNNVISSNPPDIYAAALLQPLRSTFHESERQLPLWRVLLEQSGQRYYLSLTANDARSLKIGEFARIFAELKASHSSDVLQNRATPVLIIDRAEDSPASLELNVSEYIRNPAKFLRMSYGSRSFYVFTGKVLQVLPPTNDVLEDGF